MTGFCLPRQTLLERGPAQIRFAQETLGVGGKGVAVFLAAKQIKP
ncbi:MAG: hypothetical protein QOF22_23, partial [Bradyrhizobium sp.]|nr:hypothetical protein [Bradyrhizobium sp.]